MKNDHVEKIIQTSQILNRERSVTAKRMSRNENIVQELSLQNRTWTLKEPTPPEVTAASVPKVSLSAFCSKLL